MKVNNDYSIDSLVAQKEEKRKNLDINDFIKIMVAEISNINPMGGSEGGSKTDYIAQMAQFSTLEQMSTIAEGIGLLNLMGQQQYSFSLIGKEVTINTWESNEKGEYIYDSGVVEKVKFKGGYIIIQVNGEEYPMGDVTEVGGAGTKGPETTEPEPEVKDPELEE